MTDFTAVEAEVLDAKASDLVAVGVAVLTASREVGAKFRDAPADVPQAVLDFVARVDELAREYIQSRQ